MKVLASPRTVWSVRARTIAAVLLLLLVVVVVRLTLVDVVRVSSASMSPTTCTGDVILLGRHVPAGGPDIGDVITFPGPQDGAETLKRVVARGGQSVGIADAVLVVDGHPVAESYVDLASLDGVYFGPVTVPVGSVFVMGDDREISIDSRMFGPVRVADVDGRMLTRLWSACPS